MRNNRSFLLAEVLVENIRHEALAALMVVVNLARRLDGGISPSQEGLL